MCEHKKVLLKKAVIYGDSISTRKHGNGGYQTLLQERMEIGCIANHAVSSSGLAGGTPGSTSELLKNPRNIHRDAELIIIWHGSNDWYWGSDIGSLRDTDTDTFLGALKWSVDLLRKASPKAYIIWPTPLFRYEKPDGCSQIGDGYQIPNKKGYTLKDYHHAIMEASTQMGFFVVDFRQLMNFHYDNADLYFEDKVHPNKDGYRRINEILCRHLEFILLSD